MAAGTFLVPDTSMPFVEMLAFALHSLEPDQFFVPMTDENNAYKIMSVRDIGMQARVSSFSLKPKTIVINGN